MYLKTFLSSFLFILCFSSYGYTVLHDGYITNETGKEISIVYLSCDKYTRKNPQTNKTEISYENCKNNSAILNDTNKTLTFNLDYTNTNRVDKKNGYQLLKFIHLKNATLEGKTTSFITINNKLKEKSSLNPWCRMELPGKILVLYSDKNNTIFCENAGFDL